MKLYSRYWLKMFICVLSVGGLLVLFNSTGLAQPQHHTHLATMVLPILQSEEGHKPALPKTKKIPVVVEGMREEREATLFESAQGFYMYILPQFVAFGEEPGKDIIFSKADNRFSMRIEKLGTSVDQKKLRQLAEIELAEIGQVTERKVSRDPFWNQVAFYLASSNPQTIKEILLVQVDGVWFKVTRFMVNNEAIEGIEPSMRAMLQTIQVK